MNQHRAVDRLMPAAPLLAAIGCPAPPESHLYAALSVVEDHVLPGQEASRA